MNKIAMLGFAVIGIVGTLQPCEARPAETDRYRIEFTGKEGERFRSTVIWSGPGGREAPQYNKQINRQLPFAFEIDLPYGSTLLTDSYVVGDDPISVEILLNGFRCEDIFKQSPSKRVWRTCLP
jgi:hypothetical protein